MEKIVFDKRLIQRSWESMKAAGVAHNEIVRSSFSVGDKLSWKHGNHWRWGEVVEPVAIHGSVCVRVNSGKVQRIDAVRIERASKND